MVDKNDNASTAGDWLAREDGATRVERAARLEWLVARYPVATGFLISGGWLSYQLLQEAKECFVYGQYLATAILGVAFVERVLAAEFFAAGRNDLERSGGLDLLREALASGRLSPEEFQRFDRMRQLRNPLVHFRRPLASGTVEARAVQQGTHPDSVLAADAEAILEGALAMLQRSAV
jgi:hypothetical protein